MFYEKEGAVLRDAEDGDLEIWVHEDKAWMPYTYALHQIDPTTIYPINDEQAEALTNDQGPLQPSPSAAPARQKKVRPPLLVQP